MVAVGLSPRNDGGERIRVAERRLNRRANQSLQPSLRDARFLRSLPVGSSPRLPSWPRSARRTGRPLAPKKVRCALFRSAGQAVLVIQRRRCYRDSRLAPKMNPCCQVRRRCGALSFLLFLFASVVQVGAQEGYWDSRFWIPEFSVPVRTAVDSSGRLILAGNRLGILGSLQNSLGCWDGRRWEMLATNAGTLNVVVTLTNDVVIGGRFTRVNGVAATNIARFDGIGWHSFGDGLPGVVFAIAADASSVIAGGDFASVTNSTLTNIARWNSQQWQNIGGGVPGRVLSVAVATNGELFAASDGISNQVPASVWRWDGQQWMSIGDFGEAGVRRVRRLAWMGDSLFAALAPADSNNCVMRWQGNQWTSVGDVSLSGVAEVLAIGENGLIAGGALTWVRDGETNRSGIARLVNGRWVTDLAEESLSTLDLAVAGREMYALGLINDGISDKMARGVWHFDGRTWGQLNNGLRFMDQCYRIAEIDSRIIVTGFTSKPELFGGLAWDGRQWQRLGTAPPAGSTLRMQRELGRSGSTVLANAVLNIGTPSATGVLAHLDGTNWVQATEPFPLTVSAISGDGRNVFAAGRMLVSNSSFGTVWQWDGSKWQQLGGLFKGQGSSLAGFISALAYFGGSLYAGGTFTNIGGAMSLYFARWDGQRWEAVGEPLDGSISAFSATSDGLLAVGRFVAAGSNQLDRVAVWENNAWRGLGAGLIMTNITAVAGGPSGVVAVGGSRAGRPEVWLRRGGNWSLVGFDASSTFLVNHMLWRGQDLHIAGGFIFMGGQESDTYAIWHEAPALAEVVGYQATGFELRFSGALPRRFAVERSLDLETWEAMATNTPANPAEVFVDAAARGNPRGFFRAASEP